MKPGDDGSDIEILAVPRADNVRLFNRCSRHDHIRCLLHSGSGILRDILPRIATVLVSISITDTCSPIYRSGLSDAGLVEIVHAIDWKTLFCLLVQNVSQRLLYE